MRISLSKCFAFVLAVFCMLIASVHMLGQGKVTHLRCDSLVTPLGDDHAQPMLSWMLEDARHEASQSAYRIQVADSRQMLAHGRANVWDSGRVRSNRSTGVAYEGPKLEPAKRYFWRVEVWGKEGKTYPPSDMSWWETGLMDTAHWQAQWIGYEDAEHAAVRAANAAWVSNPRIAEYHGNGNAQHQLRLAFDLEKPVAYATLYATGEDTAAAWINGHQVLSHAQQVPWGRLPWRTYEAAAATDLLQAGKNLLSISVLLYGNKNRSQTPMNAVLYVRFKDGTEQIFKTGQGEWKSSLDAAGPWYMPQYDDSKWAAPIICSSSHAAFDGAENLGIPLQTPPVALLRKRFAVNKAVRSARLYATALGLYRISVNGVRAGDQELSPGWTDYRQRVAYQAYDVTEALHAGENAIGAYLAPGWYATPLEWVGQGNNYGSTPPSLKAQLRIEYTDGSIQWVSTDESWRAQDSPILSAEIYNGETYDARRSQKGWDLASFGDASWHAVAVLHPHEPEIVWQSYPPIRAIEQVAPKAVTHPAPGISIYDFGQNLAGVAHLRTERAKGTQIKLRYGEELNSDGTLFVANLRNAKATDSFTFAGNGLEEYQPSFTFHGFRYLEVSGLSEPLPLSDVKVVVLHTDATEDVKLHTGNSMVNQLWSNILWGQRSNFVGLPTDCPQRDERLGWSADAQVFWRTASYNMDLQAFSRKFATDLRGTQVGTDMYGIYAPGTAKPNVGFGPGWSDAGVIIPWTAWMQTGDLTILEQNWDAMRRYVDAIHEANPDGEWKNKIGIRFGDWLSPEGDTSEELIATAYWAYDVALLRQMAHALGKYDDERSYGQLFETIRGAFQREFVHPGGLVGQLEKGKSPAKIHETQTGYVLALYMNLLAAEDRMPAANHLVARIAANGGKLGTGFLGTPYLLEVLSDTGHSDVAYHLLLERAYPSWGYMIDHGATTMWERWNGDQMRGDPGMNSYNHYAYGAVAEWIYRYAAGVDTVVDDPGFHTIDLHPNFDARLGSLDFSYQSLYGVIRSAWSVMPEKITWNVTIPPNTQGRVVLTVEQQAHYLLNGKQIKECSLQKKMGEDGRVQYLLPAGSYDFLIQTPAS